MRLTRVFDVIFVAYVTGVGARDARPGGRRATDVRTRREAAAGDDAGVASRPRGQVSYTLVLADDDAHSGVRLHACAHMQNAHIVAMRILGNLSYFTVYGSACT